MRNDEYITTKLDGRNRLIVPTKILSEAKISSFVRLEIQDGGVLMTPFDPETGHVCKICGAGVPTQLIKVKKNEYICTVCSRRILKAVGAECKKPKEEDK